MEEFKDKGFQRGGGVIVESDRRPGISRGDFGTGEVNRFKTGEGDSPPVRKREMDEDVVFNRGAFGTGKAEERRDFEKKALGPPRKPREDRKEGWEKGTGKSPEQAVEPEE